jgi:predicted amidohydrolase YtcJ
LFNDYGQSSDAWDPLSFHYTFEESIKGSIEVGQLADLVILSDDFLSVPEQKIKDIRAVTTIVDGKVVYQRSQ